MEDGASNGNYYLNKYLNSLSPLRFLLFNLKLKVGCPIMLLQNIVLREGLYNGLHLIFMELID